MSSSPTFVGYPILCDAPLSGRYNRNATTCSATRMVRRKACEILLGSTIPLLIQPAVSHSEIRQDALSGISAVSKKLFAEGMEAGMIEYEENISNTKRRLFSHIKQSDLVMDIGMGTGPNLKYMPIGVEMIGLEPNVYMWPYAEQKAKQYGVSLQMIEGTVEQIPMKNESCDIVITTLTLCSVPDFDKAMKEIIRILKPGGKHIFIEHVIAGKNRPILRAVQNVLNPLQVLLAEGCHLNRNTGLKLENAGFDEIEYEEFDAKFNVIENLISPVRPHIAGYCGKKKNL